MIRPRPNTALVRAIATDDRLPGSRIYLVPDTVHRMTASQMELVALGPPDSDDDAEIHDLSHLKPGDWLLVRPRTWISAGMKDHWFIPHDSVIGVFPH